MVAMNCHVDRLLKVGFRWATPRDLPGIYEVEREGSELPWEESRFLAALNRPEARIMVAEYGGRVAGFLLYEVLDDGLYIHRLAVRSFFRRRGVASQLFARVYFLLSTGVQRCVRLDVRESNLSAQLFFRSLGFRAVRIEKEFFSDTGEDAYRMQYRRGKSGQWSVASVQK